MPRGAPLLLASARVDGRMETATVDGADLTSSVATTGCKRVEGGCVGIKTDWGYNAHFANNDIVGEMKNKQKSHSGQT